MYNKLKDKIVWALVIVSILLCLTDMSLTAHAEEDDFAIDAEMLATGKDTFDVSITVENFGKDWEGTLRLIPNEDYARHTTAYDTIISLPQGTTKQFVVKIPKSENSAEGTVRIILLDKKSNKAADKEFRNLLKENVKALSMGILSDDYASLTYLDMGGDKIYYNFYDYPIRLVELDLDSLADSLDALTFLVIDSYNTDVLTDEVIDKIDQWVDNGGVLIVGTGKYAEETLKGLGSLNISCSVIHEPDEELSSIGKTDVDFSKISIAQLTDLKGFYYKSDYSEALLRSSGDGAIGVLSYSLSEFGKLDSSAFNGVDQEDFVMQILNETSSNASSRYGGAGYNNDTDYTYIMDRIFAILGNCNSSLNFGVLKLIVVAYVVFAGPLLYLILRFLKKRELYWIAVPATAFFAIVLVFFAGRGFTVANTRVYSITVENLSDRSNNKTYMYCYDADHREWDLRLADGYEYIWAFAGNGYSYGSYGSEGDYFYHIRKEGDEFFFGINPDKNFDDGYFIAGETEQKASGNIVGDRVLSSWTGAGVYGTVTNETDKDFKYFAVVSNGTLYVYGNLPAGQSCDLGTAEVLYTSSQSWRDDVCGSYLYDYIYDSYHNEEKSETGVISALGIGLCSAYSENDADKTLIIGVTQDWDKTVDDNCSEISYGCLYAIQ